MKEDVLELCLARMTECVGEMRRSALSMDRLSSTVERMANEQGKTEMRDLGYRDDLLTVRRESTDAILGFTKVAEVIRDDLKDALEIRKREADRDPSWLRAINAVLKAPTTKIVIITLAVGFFIMLAIANGWIKMPGK